MRIIVTGLKKIFEEQEAASSAANARGAKLWCPVYLGWGAIASYFAAGQPSSNVGQILEDLSNPPFKYDENTLALLSP